MSEDRAGLRARARDRAVLSTFVASGGQQAVIVVATLVSMPFVTRALSPEEYGVVATLSGVVALLAFTDLGIGAALTARVSTARARDDEDAARRAVSSAVVGAAAAALVLALLVVLLTFVLPWNALLGAPGVPQGSLRAAVLCAGLSMALTVVSSLGQRLMYGVQRGALAARWLALAAVASAGASVAAALVGASPAVFVLAALAVPALVGLLGLVRVVLHHEPGLAPRRDAVSLAELRMLAGSGGWFLVIAVAAAVGYETDVLIVASVLGAAQAGVYSVCLRLFGLVVQVVYPALLQLWPAMTDAHERGELDWLRSRLVRGCVLAAGAAAVAGALLVLLGGEVVRVWLRPELEPSRGLLLAFALWTVYSLGSAPLFLLMNATGRVRTHALVAVVVAVVNLPASLVLAHVVGISGPVLGSLMATAGVNLVPGVLVAHRVLRSRAVAPAASATPASPSGA